MFLVRGRSNTTESDSIQDAADRGVQGLAWCVVTICRHNILVFEKFRLHLIVGWIFDYVLFELKFLTDHHSQKTDFNDGKFNAIDAKLIAIFYENKAAYVGNEERQHSCYYWKDADQSQRFEKWFWTIKHCIEILPSK